MDKYPKYQRGWLPFFICLRTVLELLEKSNTGETVGLSEAKEFFNKKSETRMAASVQQQQQHTFS